MNTTECEVSELIKRGECLSLEFKSDKNCLPDKDLVDAVVSLANTDGGDLLLGVEDNGKITGLHAQHISVSGLPPLIANKTNPSISVRAELLKVFGHTIARIHVPKSQQLVSTSDDRVLRRREKVDGTPEAVPLYPHEFNQRQSFMGNVDPSDMVLEEIDVNQFDSLQRQRLRNAIEIYHGEEALLKLADRELDGALKLSREVNGVLRPTVTGLLLLGTERLLRQHLPTYEVAFQVLQGTEVRTNEFFRKPLLETFEQVENLFKSRLDEAELDVGLFRVPVPNYNSRAFREAFVNALVHRDFHELGFVRVAITDDGLEVSNPGGFIDGVNLDNLLVAIPKSRNPSLADAIKRIGLAERTGRGIDRIFEGMLRYGRPAPDYTMSDRSSVSVRMANVAADLDFLKMVLEQENKSGSMPIDSLIVLSRLREERRLTTEALAPFVQKPENAIRATLEKLVETGLVETHGTGRRRTYTLSVKLYQKAGKKSEYIRQAGFSAIQQEQMVLSFIDKHKKITRGDVMDLCHIVSHQAYKLLSRLKERGDITQIGERKSAFYVRKQ